MAGRPRNQAAGTAILAAAIGILRERGYAALTLEEVARVAGVGKSSLYARFSGRSELAAAAVAGLQRELPPPRGELRDDLTTWLRAAERDLAQVGPDALGAMLAAGPQTTQRILAPFAARARRELEIARSRGALGEQADLEVALELLVGILLSRVLLDGPSNGWPEPAVAAVLSWLGCPAPSRI